MADEVVNDERAFLGKGKREFTQASFPEDLGIEGVVFLKKAIKSSGDTAQLTVTTLTSKVEEIVTAYADKNKEAIDEFMKEKVIKSLTGDDCEKILGFKVRAVEKADAATGPECKYVLFNELFRTAAGGLGVSNRFLGPDTELGEVKEGSFNFVISTSEQKTLPLAYQAGYVRILPDGIVNKDTVCLIGVASAPVQLTGFSELKDKLIEKVTTPYELDIRCAPIVTTVSTGDAGKVHIRVIHSNKVYRELFAALTKHVNDKTKFQTLNPSIVTGELIRLVLPYVQRIVRAFRIKDKHAYCNEYFPIERVGTLFLCEDPTVTVLSILISKIVDDVIAGGSSTTWTITRDFTNMFRSAEVRAGTLKEFFEAQGVKLTVQMIRAEGAFENWVKDHKPSLPVMADDKLAIIIMNQVILSKNVINSGSVSNNINSQAMAARIGKRMIGGVIGFQSGAGKGAAGDKELHTYNARDFHLNKTVYLMFGLPTHELSRSLLTPVPPNAADGKRTVRYKLANDAISSFILFNFLVGACTGLAAFFKFGDLHLIQKDLCELAGKTGEKYAHAKATLSIHRVAQMANLATKRIVTGVLKGGEGKILIPSSFNKDLTKFYDDSAPKSHKEFVDRVRQFIELMENGANEVTNELLVTVDEDVPAEMLPGQGKNTPNVTEFKIHLSHNSDEKFSELLKVINEARNLADINAELAKVTIGYSFKQGGEVYTASVVNEIGPDVIVNDDFEKGKKTALKMVTDLRNIRAVLPTTNTEFAQAVASQIINLTYILHHTCDLHYYKDGNQVKKLGEDEELPPGKHLMTVKDSLKVDEAKETKIAKSLEEHGRIRFLLNVFVQARIMYSMNMIRMNAEDIGKPKK